MKFSLLGDLNTSGCRPAKEWFELFNCHGSRSGDQSNVLVVQVLDELIFIFIMYVGSTHPA